jgi:hypothetical protein
MTRPEGLLNDLRFGDIRFRRLRCGVDKKENARRRNMTSANKHTSSNQDVVKFVAVKAPRNHKVQQVLAITR